MGKAIRWLKGLFGMKKDREKRSRKFSNTPDNVHAEDSSWLRAEQNKHAIAVAAATAAAADAAVAAAQAAVAVVRLTSQGRGAVFNLGRENQAALKIQSVFRGYLAKRALRALKGLVKIQALVRGYLVRKRTAATLHSMQALIRAQSAARSRRARRSVNVDRLPPETRARKSIERYDECRSAFHSRRLSASSYDTSFNGGLDESPKIVEIDTFKLKSKTRNACMSECGDDPYYYHAPSCPAPGRVSLPDYDWSFLGEDMGAKFHTAQNTPRAPGRRNAPPTPPKSVCGDHFPSYMANTQSFQAKLRSHSAPRQRPEAAVGPTKKRMSLNDIMASRSSFTGVRMQTPCNVREEYHF
ncbi:unnamed protein product [Cuscuta epithymum]|uniref:DUF4005 domain-containing protein n=1 Tax=Cuscuta epithymum TaxID=186058 RepID=A0AAV0C7N0_9ASTE|nr:unnamed protein product [Cuscuta epithymum]